MGKIAYKLSDAAKAVSVKQSDISAAIKAGELIARGVGDTYVICRTDIEGWLTARPDFYEIS